MQKTVRKCHRNQARAQCLFFSSPVSHDVGQVNHDFCIVINVMHFSTVMINKILQGYIANYVLCTSI